MKNKHLILSLFTIIVLFASCESDDKSSDTDGGNAANQDKFIITATPTASEGVADYILTADDLTQGKITTVGNGVEQDGTYRYYVTANNKFFSLLYGQGNPGAVTTYQLNTTGSLFKVSDFQAETVQAFEAVGKDILMMKISRNADAPIASWYRLDTNNSQFVAEGQINTKDLANKENKELAFFSWITQVGNKVYLPYFTVKGIETDRFGTEYPDEANIAVYSYPEMKFEKIIHDNRTSSIGRYFVNGLTVDETGDTYAFSSSVATNNGKYTSTKPSSITRIKKGSTEFDPSFLYNIEKASGGKYATTHLYLGNGKFLVNLNAKEEKGAYATGKEYAVINVYAKSFHKVTGLPTPSAILSVTERNNFADKKTGIAYVGITTTTGSFVYSIDSNTFIAKQGLEVQGGVITAINKLSPMN